MNDRSNNSAVAVAAALILIMLLAIGGVAAYFLIARQQIAVARQVEQARMAEVMARVEMETGRAEDIESVLHAQAEAWNRGDVDAFMEHYWNSDDLTFSSEGKTTRGWTATLNRYKERYPTPDKMGRVSFSNLAITPLGDSAAMVLGQWNLEREGDPLVGNFTLVLRRFDDRWLIVHDHTSRSTE